MAVRVWGKITTRIPSESFARLYGTTAEAGAPETPVRRRVQLVEAQANPFAHLFPLPIAPRTRWSDDSGVWEFKFLDPSKKYHVIAYDHTGQYDPVIKLNLVPTVD